MGVPHIDFLSDISCRSGEKESNSAILKVEWSPQIREEAELLGVREAPDRAGSLLKVSHLPVTPATSSETHTSGFRQEGRREPVLPGTLCLEVCVCD